MLGFFFYTTRSSTFEVKALHFMLPLLFSDGRKIGIQVPLGEGQGTVSFKKAGQAQQQGFKNTPPSLTSKK